MHKQGLRLLTWGLAQLWDGLSGEERSSVQYCLRRTHKAIEWPCDPAAEPPSYHGPEDIPLERSLRIISCGEGFVACYRGYLDDVQRADNAQTQLRQDEFLRRATLAEFVKLAERTAQAIRALANGEDDTTWEGSLSNEAFFSLFGLRRAKEVRPDVDWPYNALEQRHLLADAAGPLLAALDRPQAKKTLKLDGANKEIEDFTRATARLREIAQLLGTEGHGSGHEKKPHNPTRLTLIRLNKFKTSLKKRQFSKQSVQEVAGEVWEKHGWRSREALLKAWCRHRNNPALK